MAHKMTSSMEQQVPDGLATPDDSLDHITTVTTSHLEVKHIPPQRNISEVSLADSGVGLGDSYNEFTLSLRMQLNRLSVSGEDIIHEEQSTGIESHATNDDKVVKTSCPSCGRTFPKSDDTEQDTKENQMEEIKNAVGNLKQRLEQLESSSASSLHEMSNTLDSLRRSPTPDQTNSPLLRSVHSATAMDPPRPRAATGESLCYRRKKVPRLSGQPKSSSMNDADGMGSSQQVLDKHYTPIEGLPEVLRTTDASVVPVNKTSLEILLQRCSPQDLTVVELTSISNLVDPDILLKLSVYLHKDAKVYFDITHRYQHETTANKAFRILKDWYDMQHPESCCRRQLVSTFFELGKVRAANSIACIDYD